MDKKKRNIIIIVLVIILIVCAAIIFTIIQRNNSPKLTEQDVQKIALEDASITEDDATSISIETVKFFL